MGKVGIKAALRLADRTAGNRCLDHAARKMKAVCILLSRYRRSQSIRRLKFIPAAMLRVRIY